jgi:secretion/DNA translocation related CpaE-like protein
VDDRAASQAAFMNAAPVLLITRDDLLLDDLLRLAAAAGVELDVVHDTTSALRAWAGAAAVLVGADQADAVALARPPRRDQVHVLSRGAPPDGLFRAALAAGAQDVVELPAAEVWVVELLTDVMDGASRAAWTLGVVPGSGGAGGTTFACALAVTAARRESTLLLDLDPLGPGVARVVGLDDSEGVRWDALLAASGRLGSRALREALPRRGRLSVLGWGTGPSGALEAGSVREVLSAARRGHDVVVVDLPRVLGDAAAEVAAHCDQVLVVSGATVPAVASAAKVAAQLRELNGRLGAVVCKGTASLPADQVARALGLPLVAQLGRQRRLAEDIDLGLGPVRSSRSRLARAAHSVLRLPRPSQRTRAAA